MRTTVITVMALILISFMPAKFNKDFKKQKKHIDTLTIINPIVNVVANNNKSSYLDSTLSGSNQNLIEKTSFDLLSKKYTLYKEKFTDFNYENYYKVYGKLVDSPKTLEGISIESVVDMSSLNFEGRYALLMVYFGTINPDYSPHYNLKAGIASNTIVIAPHTKPHNDLQLLIIDTENNEIVFFDQRETSNIDPRIPEEIEQATKTILKKIYYK